MRTLGLLSHQIIRSDRSATANLVKVQGWSAYGASHQAPDGRFRTIPVTETGRLGSPPRPHPSHLPLARPAPLRYRSPS